MGLIILLVLVCGPLLYMIHHENLSDRSRARGLPLLYSEEERLYTKKTLATGNAVGILGFLDEIDEDKTTVTYTFQGREGKYLYTQKKAVCGSVLRPNQIWTRFVLNLNGDKVKHFEKIYDKHMW